MRACARSFVGALRHGHGARRTADDGRSGTDSIGRRSAGLRCAPTAADCRGGRTMSALPSEDLERALVQELRELCMPRIRNSLLETVALARQESLSTA